MIKENIFLLHGLMGTAASHFSPQIEFFSKKYKVIPIDLPGHGDNKRDVQHNFFDSTLEWVAQKVTTEGKSYIIGLSMGASIAIHLALHYPELIKGIVLTGYTPRIPKNMREIMELQYQGLISINDNNPQLAEQYREVHGERWYETLVTVVENFTFNYPSIFNSDLRKLQVPTLILNGGNEAHERRAVCQLSDSNPIITPGIIPNCGHIANLEKAKLYNHIVLDFLENLD